MVVIDEAQNLSDAVLERVRLLTNFETSRAKLMQIVLSGQPQLSDKLMQPSLVQLRQRISTICRLEPLSTEETSAYIDYRLKQAGYDGEPLFTKDALKLIAEASQGIPRTINNLCFNALSLCCALKSKQVDDGMVAEVIADLQLIPQSREPIAAVGEVAAEQPREREKRKQARRLLKFWIPAASALLVMCVLGVLGSPNSGSLSLATTADERSLNLKVLRQHQPLRQPRQTPAKRSSPNPRRTLRHLKSQSNPIKHFKISPCNTWEASICSACIKSRRSIRS